MVNKKIGIKIRQLRKEWGLSQIELAERIGISFQQIQKYEKGTTRISVVRLCQISDALGVNINVFFEESDATSKVTDVSVAYSHDEKRPKISHTADKQERTFLKLFRKIKNRKMRESVLKQLQGIIELEDKK